MTFLGLSARVAQPTDLDPTAHLWHAAWHETQAPFVPATLIAQRSLESFKTRLAQMGERLRIAGPVGAPIGLCSIKPRELHQLFVAPAARGKGVATELLADAEQRLLAQGDTSAFLDCLFENDAAIRFYSRNGWVKHGVQTAQLDTLDGPFELPCLIFRKELSAQ